MFYKLLCLLIIHTNLAMDIHGEIHINRDFSNAWDPQEKFYVVHHVNMLPCKKTERKKIILGRFSLKTSTNNITWGILKEFSFEEKQYKKIILKCAIQKATELAFKKIITLTYIPPKAFRKDITNPLTKKQRQALLSEIDFFAELGFHSSSWNPVFLEKDLI